MMRIVVVDDEFLVVEGVRILLKEINLETELVGTASDAEEAMEVIKKELPDLLITDIRMPGISGLDLIEKCREVLPEMLSVIISGYTEFSYAKRAIEMGVIGYVDKPITRQKLEGVLKQAEDTSYRRMLKRTDNPILMDAFNEFVKSSAAGDIDQIEMTFAQIRDQLLWENLDLDEYKRFIFMLISTLVGNYYDLMERSMGETHFPSYQNLEIMQSYEEVDSYADAMVESVIKKLQLSQNGEVHDSILHVLEYINEHFSEDLSLSRLADIVDMNSVYLSTLFKQETGKSYIKYLTELRMEHAKKLLQQGHRVAEVSEMVGYPNYRYFCDIFKKNEGVTPNEYRGGTRKKS